MHELRNELGKQKDVLCAECDRPTTHTVLAAWKTRWGDEDISRGATHECLRCNGCGEGTYRVTTWSTEDDRTETLHPPRGGHARKPHDWHHVPWDPPLCQVYRQTITTFNAGSFTLAGAGVRLLVEGVCLDQKVEDGPILDETGQQRISRKSGQPVRHTNLEGKINGLVERDFITRAQAAYLHEVRFLGNDAAHQLDRPTADDVSHAINIVEHLLDQVYEQPAIGQALAARKRPAKDPKLSATPEAP